MKLGDVRQFGILHEQPRLRIGLWSAERHRDVDTWLTDELRRTGTDDVQVIRYSELVDLLSPTIGAPMRESEVWGPLRARIAGVGRVVFHLDCSHPCTGDQCDTCQLSGRRCLPMAVRTSVWIRTLQASNHWRRPEQVATWLDVTPWRCHDQHEIVDELPGVEYVRKRDREKCPVFLTAGMDLNPVIEGALDPNDPHNGYSLPLLKTLCHDAYRQASGHETISHFSVDWQAGTSRSSRVARVTLAFSDPARPPVYEILKVGPLAAIKWERKRLQEMRAVGLSETLYEVVDDVVSESPADYIAAIRSKWTDEHTTSSPYSWLSCLTHGAKSVQQLPLDSNVMPARFAVLSKLMQGLVASLDRLHNFPDTGEAPDLRAVYRRVLPFKRYEVSLGQIREALQWNGGGGAGWRVFCVDPKADQSDSGRIFLSDSEDPKMAQNWAEVRVRIPSAIPDWGAELWRAGVIETARIDDGAFDAAVQPHAIVRELTVETLNSHGGQIDDTAIKFPAVEGNPEISFPNPLQQLTGDWESSFPPVRQGVVLDIHGDFHLGNIVSRFVDIQAECWKPDPHDTKVKFIDVADSRTRYPASLDYAALELSIKIQVVEHLLTLRFSEPDYARNVAAMIRMMVSVENDLWNLQRTPTNVAGLDEWGLQLLKSAYTLLRALRVRAKRKLRNARVFGGGAGRPWTWEKDLAQSLFFCGLGSLRHGKDLPSAAGGSVTQTHPVWSLVTAGFAARKLAPDHFSTLR